MEQKDYILREIEKISTLLLGLMGKFRKKEDSDQATTEFKLEDLKHELEKNTGVDLDQIIYSSDLNFNKLLKKESGFNEKNIELLADLMAEIELEDKTRENELKQAARNLYEYLNIHSRTYSFERIIKIGKLKEVD